MAKRGRPTKKKEIENEFKDNPEMIDDLLDDGILNKSVKKTKKSSKEIVKEVFEKEIKKEVPKKEEILIDNSKSRVFVFASVAQGTRCNIADKMFGVGDRVEFTNEEIEKYDVIREFIANYENKCGNNKLIEIKKV